MKLVKLYCSISGNVILLSISLVVLLVTGCQKNIKPTPIPIGKIVKHVYVVGTNSSVGLLWDNAKESSLLSNEQSDGAFAYGISTGSGHIYVAGYNDNGKKAVVWKDGVAGTLTDGTKDAAAYSVFAQNNNVYAVGNDGDDAMLWKNGVGTKLESLFIKNVARSVFLKGSDVYVAGNTGPIAVVWKNGDHTDLRNNETRVGEANGVFVKGKDVYVAGFGVYANRKNVAQLWKNGTTIKLTDGTRDAVATAVFVTDKDVYVVGYEKNSSGINVAKIWINGVALELYAENAVHQYATAIAVEGDEIYVAGYEQEPNLYDGPSAKYWLLSKTDLTQEENILRISAMAYGVSVMYRPEK